MNTRPGAPRWIRCYDNGGIDNLRRCRDCFGRRRERCAKCGERGSIDRYTVVFTKGARFYLAMNAAPLQPWGFGQHGEWNKGEPPIDRRPGYGHLGRRIAFAEMPAECQRAVWLDYEGLHPRERKR